MIAEIQGLGGTRKPSDRSFNVVPQAMTAKAGQGNSWRRRLGRHLGPFRQNAKLYRTSESAGHGCGVSARPSPTKFLKRTRLLRRILQQVHTKL